MWMMKMLLMMLSSQIMQTKNQMSMITLIVISSFTLSTMIFMTTNNHWFSLLLLLIYISGVMVLFMFIVSLSPNEKVNLKPDNKKTTLTLMFAPMLMKILTNSESTKINSSMEWSLLTITLMVIIISTMAYLPNKIISSLYKGMKSTK